MASYRNIINPKHIGEYQPPNERKKSEPYQIRRREVTKNDMRQIPNIINSIDTTVKSRFKLRNPYHHEGNINYLLSQLVYSIYQNDGIPSSSHKQDWEYRAELLCVQSPVPRQYLRTGFYLKTSGHHTK